MERSLGGSGGLPRGSYNLLIYGGDEELISVHFKRPGKEFES